MCSPGDGMLDPRESGGIPPMGGFQHYRRRFTSVDVFRVSCSRFAFVWRRCIPGMQYNPPLPGINYRYLGHG